MFLCLFAELRGEGDITSELKIYILCRQYRILSKWPERNKQRALMLGK